MKNQESKYQENRDKLKQLSKVAKQAIKVNGGYQNVNDYVIRECYTTPENTEFNTFFQWREKGFKVKKGEHAFVIWGAPMKAQKTEHKEKQNDDEFSFYPLCYLFSNKQVEPFKNNK
jgi:hypothetical protein